MNCFFHSSHNVPCLILFPKRPSFLSPQKKRPNALSTRGTGWGSIPEVSDLRENLDALKKKTAKKEGASKTIKIGCFFSIKIGWFFWNLQWVYSWYLFLSKVCGCVLLVLGMGDLQPLIGNPYNGYINPYYWVDDHPLIIWI